MARPLCGSTTSDRFAQDVCSAGLNLPRAGIVILPRRASPQKAMHIAAQTAASKWRLRSK
jgi:hypothetical protein